MSHPPHSSAHASLEENYKTEQKNDSSWHLWSVRIDKKNKDDKDQNYPGNGFNKDLPDGSFCLQVLYFNPVIIGVIYGTDKGFLSTTKYIYKKTTFYYNKLIYKQTV